MARSFVPSLLVAAVFALLPGTALGPGTGAARLRQTIDTPAAEECEVGRRSLEALQRLAATPPPTTAEPTASADDFEPPAGEPADDETVAAITATQREATACANAGDRIRVMSLYSEGFIWRILADAAAQGMSVEQLYDIYTPGGWVRPSDRVGLKAVREARMLPDGRVGAFVDVAIGGDPDLGETNFVYYVQNRGTWLIDGFVLVDIFLPDAPSPTPE